MANMDITTFYLYLESRYVAQCRLKLDIIFFLKFQFMDMKMSFKMAGKILLYLLSAKTRSHT